MRRTICLLLLLCVASLGLAQRILLLERANNPRSERIPVGAVIEYQLTGDSEWLTGKITELRADQQLIVMADRFVMLDEIAALRFNRGLVRALSVSLFTFGTAWSGFALIGYATDGDPSTRYGVGDAIVSAVSIGSGLLLNSLLGNRKFRTGERRRLRIIDVSFK